MLTEYLRAAMHHATYALMEDGKRFWGEIPELQGVWAIGTSLEACRDELAEVLEEWVILQLRDGIDLPPIDGVAPHVRDVA
jgi:predicted RNase H-like HicB family nuclease